MEINEARAVGGSLQISTDVISKISQMAALEIDGVKEISTGTVGVRGMFKKVSAPKPIEVNLVEGIAQITVNVIVKYGNKIQPLSAKIQENVKNAVQNMTGITVARVNIVIAGVSREEDSEQIEG